MRRAVWRYLPALAVVVGLAALAAGSGLDGGGDSDRTPGPAGELPGFPPVPAVGSRPGPGKRDVPADADLFVSPAGDDSNPGTSRRPFRTVERALAATTGGETIAVHSGQYPPFTDTKVHPAQVTVVGVGPEPPVIGADPAHKNITVALSGARGVKLSNFRLLGEVKVEDHPTLKQDQAARDIVLEDLEVTAQGRRQVCVRIRSGARRVTVRRSYIHHCQGGIAGPGKAPRSAGVRIELNWLEHFAGDGIQFTGWDDVVIDRNVIAHVRDPAGETHNDGIQTAGDARRIVISNNVVHDVVSAAIFIQPAFGAIHDVQVFNNLLYRYGAHAIQLQGTTGGRLVNNTMWGGGLPNGRGGGIVVRPAAPTPQNPNPGSAPADTIVVNNIMPSFGALDGARVAVEDYNVLRNRPVDPGPHDVFTAHPVFMNPARGDYRLTRSWRSRLKGSREYAPRLDQRGRRRASTPTVGAFE